MGEPAFDIAEAVAAELNAAPAGTFALAVRAEFFDIPPEFRIEDLGYPHVSVVPARRASSAYTRAALEHQCKVDLAVQGRVEDAPAARAALAALTRQIEQYLERRPLAAVPGANWTGVERDFLGDAEQLRALRVFTALITLTYSLVS